MKAETLSSTLEAFVLSQGLIKRTEYLAMVGLGKLPSGNRLIGNTVEPRLSGPRLSGLFDYPDFLLWSQFSHEY